jgi:hypothetical protein
MLQILQANRMLDKHRVLIAHHHHQFLQEDHVFDSGDLCVETVEDEFLVEEVELSYVDVFSQLEDDLEGEADALEEQLLSVSDSVGLFFRVFGTLPGEIIQPKFLIQQPQLPGLHPNIHDIQLLPLKQTHLLYGSHLRLADHLIHLDLLPAINHQETPLPLHTRILNPLVAHHPTDLPQYWVGFVRVDRIELLFGHYV